MRRRTLLSGMAICGAVILATLIVTFGPDGTAPPPSSTTEPSIELGATVYADNCASCHGEDLEGAPNWRTALPDGGYPAPPHDETGHTWHHADALLFDYTKRGGQAIAGDAAKSNMPGFDTVLSDAEIAAVIAFIKSTWPPDIQRRQQRTNRQSASSLR